MDQGFIDWLGNYDGPIITVVAVVFLFFRELWDRRRHSPVLMEQSRHMGIDLYEHYLKISDQVNLGDQELEKFVKAIISNIKQLSRSQKAGLYIFEDSHNYTLVCLGGDTKIPSLWQYNESQAKKTSMFFQGDVFVLRKEFIDSMLKTSQYLVHEKYFAIPLIKDSQLYGIVCIEKSKLSQRYRESLSRYLPFMLNCLLHIINQKKSVKREMEFTELTSMTVAQRYLSDYSRRSQTFSKSIQVSFKTEPVLGVNTDLIEVVKNDKGNTFFCVIDIAGKGVASAMALTITRTIFLDGADQNKKPSQILGQINVMLKKRLNLERYGSCGIMLWIEESRTLMFTGTAPLSFVHFKLLDKKISRFQLDGSPIALQAKAIYEDKSVSLDSGDLFIAYTDGLIEAQNNLGIHFGYQNVLKTLMNYYAHSTKDFANSLMRDVNHFIEGEPLHDDMSYLIIKGE